MLTPSDFDEADFSVPDPDAHPDEVVLPASLSASRQLVAGGRNISATTTPVLNQNRPPINPVSRPQQLGRPPTVGQIAQNVAPPQPLTPTNGFSRANSAVGNSMKPPPQDNVPRVLNQPSRLALNQPSRNTNPPSAPSSPAHVAKSFSDDLMTDLPPPGQGFFSARAAANVPEGSKAELLAPNTANLAAFNPHAESPSIPKTPGVDHTKTKPLTRHKTHVPGKSTEIDAIATGPIPRPNLLNPQMDSTRRIGAPGGGSPMANRSSGYKPPTVKRPLDGNIYPPSRVPLHDLPANGTVGLGDGSDLKRQRLNG